MRKIILLLALFLVPIQADARTYINMGECKITYYCPCEICSEGWGHQTYSGKTARSEHTVAVDPNVIAYGTKLLIDGHVYTAEDCGGNVRGDHVDIYLDSHELTEKLGVKYTDVWIVRGSEWDE